MENIHITSDEDEAQSLLKASRRASIVFFDGHWPTIQRLKDAAASFNGCKVYVQESKDGTKDVKLSQYEGYRPLTPGQWVVFIKED